MHIHLPYLSVYMPEPRIHKQARSLAAAGHTVTVIALWRPGQALQEEIDGYQVKRMRLFTGAWRGRLVAPFVKWIEFSLRLWLYCLRHRADVIQANDAKALPQSWLCAKITRAVLIYDARELETGLEFGSFRLSHIYRRLWSLPETVFIRSAEVVITVSESIASELVKLYSIPRPVVIMNCPERRTPGSSDRLRQELGISHSKRIALFEGFMSAGRGIEPFLQALQSVPEVVGVVLGDGPLLSMLRDRYQNEPRVILPGRVPMEQLPEYIESADFGVALIQDTCLSNRYSLPNKLFEYLQGGIPVIASDLPEIARIVRIYQTGILVDPEDPPSIADGIHRLLQDPDTYSNYRSNARKAAETLTWEQESQKLLALYQALEKRKRL